MGDFNLDVSTSKVKSKKKAVSKKRRILKTFSSVTRSDLLNPTAHIFISGCPPKSPGFSLLALQGRGTRHRGLGSDTGPQIRRQHNAKGRPKPLASPRLEPNQHLRLDTAVLGQISASLFRCVHC